MYHTYTHLLRPPIPQSWCVFLDDMTFLANNPDKVRGETAEYFYLTLQSKDLDLDDADELEAILLETAWYGVMLLRHKYRY